MLQPVQNVLSTQYAAIGITEELDTTIILFDKALSTPKLHWSVFLESQMAFDVGGEASDAVNESVLQSALGNPRILAALKLDILLYEHAVEVLREQVASHSID